MHDTPDALWRRWRKRLAPAPRTANPGEWLRAALGACMGLALCCIACGHVFGTEVALRLAGPLGASSLLVFAVASSPLAQPWSVVMGNLVAALVGTAAGLWIDHSVLAATLGLAVTVLAMYGLRCLHPPGTALAVSVALGGPAFEAQGFAVAWPVLLGSTLLVAVALAYNRLTRSALSTATSQARVGQHLTADPLPSERGVFSDEDLDQALEEFGEFVDITRDDLERLLRQTERNALRRSVGQVTAEQIMSRDLLTATAQTTREQAWKLFEKHHIKALPVLDEQKQLVGIVTPGDLFRHARDETPGSLFGRLRHRPAPRLGELMTRSVRCVKRDTDIGVLVSMLSDQGLHCLPVLGDDEKLVGLVTQSDLIGGLYRHWLKDLTAQAPAPALKVAS